MELKKEIMPLYSYVLVEPFEENPYEVRETETGLKLTSGEFDSPDTGNREKKDYITSACKIIEVGSDCKYAKPGDHALFDMRYSQPIMFKGNFYFRVAEQNLIVLMGDDLSERFNKE